MLFDEVKYLGVTDDTPLKESRYIRLANTIIILYSVTIFLLAIQLYINYGLIKITYEMFGMSLLYASILLITVFGKPCIARHLIALGAPIGVFVVSVLLKMNVPTYITEFSFINVRTLLLATAIVPLVLFSYKERRFIYVGLLFSVVLMVFFNSLHDMLGVGFEKLIGLPHPGYAVSGIYYSVTYFFIAAVLLFFKRLNYQLYLRNENLINELNKTNNNLKKLVEEKTSQLLKSNDELRKYNIELQQYSNTISHNLRGPIANLLGLTNLFGYENSEELKKELISHIQSSAKSLDCVITDLGKISDARNCLSQIKEQVRLSEEFEKVKRLLDKNIENSNVGISTNFEYDAIYCVRSHLNSILFNLLSNAIKYSDPKRFGDIRVRSYLKDNILMLEVEDNGLGIDLERFGHNLFGMYKRFHDHVEGKGLGLFLTKQQVESLGGKIEVKSVPNEGTKIIVSCPNPKPSMMTEQLYFKSEKVEIWFDAMNLVSTLVWKERPTSEEYREAQTRNKEIFKAYKCIGFLSDVRKLGPVEEEDRKWFINNIIAGAPEFGMKKFIVVHDENDGRDDQYYEAMRHAAKSRGVLFDYGYHDLKAARRLFSNGQVIA